MATGPNRFIAAAIQSTAVFLDLEATLVKTERLVKDAAAQGAKLMVFPEAYLTNYPIWIWGDRGGDIPNLEQEGFVRLWRSAIDVPGPETVRIGEMAKTAGAVIAIGINERESAFGRATLYNTVLTFDADGTLLGKHRKLVPTYRERTVWGAGDASGLQVRETAVGRVGSLICWENYMPLSRFSLYASGMQIHAAVTVDDSPSWARLMQTIAAEGRTFVVSSSTFLRRGDTPNEPMLSSFAPEVDVAINGGSLIAGPNGVLLAGPLYGEEGIVTAEIDLDRIVAEKHSLDVTGHYSRPDIFQLGVNRRPVTPVSFSN